LNCLEATGENKTMSYLEERRHQKQFGKKPKEEKKYSLRSRTIEKYFENKKTTKTKDESSDIFFNDQRKVMTGVCQCGCGKPSQKDHDVYFRFCICHIFPKKLFPSIATHPMNWVERAFWGGHHTNMDNRSIELWTSYSDWSDIKEKFHILAPLLSDKERKKKFFTTLEALVLR
jgi:hypothetical protein